MTRRVFAVLMLAGVCVRVSAADPAGPVTREEAAAHLARVASLDLGVHESPGVEDYQVAAEAMAIASEVRPGDAELARLVAAAAWGAGDRARLMEATRTIIRADPADTVAQLRLISANINERQTVEDRLAAYERFLGPDGSRIDASVRSRLALDAALLRREQGDRAGFERMLRQAADLDGTNKDAVSLAARTFGTDAAGAKTVAEWQVRLLYADPLDPHVHLTIARLCANQGALGGAGRFLANGVHLFEISTGSTPVILREQQLALKWQQQGPKAVLDELNPPLFDMRTEAGNIIKARVEAGEPRDDIKDPEDIRYDLGVEQVRLLASHAAGDEDSLKSSLNDLAMTTEDTLAELSKAANQRGSDRVAILGEMIRVFMDLQVMRGIVGQEADKFESEIAEFTKSVPGGAEITSRSGPWLMYAKGDPAGAIAAVGTPQPGTLEDLLVALASEKTGDIDRAARIYTVYARQRGLEAYGAFARTRLRAMGREADAESTEGAEIEKILGRVPAWVDRMTLEARAFMLLQVDTPSNTVGPLETTQVRVRLKNTAPIALGLGSGRPIGSRFLISPRPINGEYEYAGTPTPKVLELDRRLRLNPLEEVQAVVEADSAYTDWLRDANAQTSLRDRYRVIQSFQPGPKGGLINGPLSLVGESGIVQRVMLPMSRSPASDIVAAAGSDDPVLFRAAAVATLSRMISPSQGLVFSEDDRRSIAKAWGERFVRASDAERAFLLLTLPHAGQDESMEGFDASAVETIVGDGLERAKADPIVLAAAMLTRVRTPDSPVFELAAQSPDERVRGLGAMLKARVERMGRGYASAGPGVEGLAPPTQALRPELTR